MIDPRDNDPAMPLLDAYLAQLQAGEKPDRHVIFAIGLLILGAIVSYLVQRLRILSSFYGQPL